MHGEIGKDGARSSALWGKRSGSRSRRVVTLAVVALAAAAAATAATAAPAKVGPAKGLPAPTKDYSAFVDPVLLGQAQKFPNKLFDVIIQGDGEKTSGKVAKIVAEAAADVMPGPDDQNATRVLKNRVDDLFLSINGLAVSLKGKEILKIADEAHIVAITSDAPIELAAFENKQKWTAAADVAKYWGEVGGTKVKPPTIAIVDSGIDANRADFDFGKNVLVQKTMTTLQPNSPGDGRGHGTFVAGIAAGVAKGYAGAAPTAPIVSIDVMNDQGMARTSDVIAAADWILQNRQTYNIKVANFSLHAAVPASIMYDPLDQAVERLWFAGVTVVAAAGNYGVDGAPSSVAFAPGNDPFVITVGAADIGTKIEAKDDFAAPWSAYGYTLDGFAKPELGAPGRYMIGPVPANATLVSERPEAVRGNGYMELSGTSFSAPLVAGIAAYLLGLHPEWTPDQVKGALMVTANATPAARAGSLGVGEVDGKKASEFKGTPPNPNAGLNRFVTTDSSGSGSGQRVFDSASWAHNAQTDASWASASWASASWASASWASASWASASWASASWASASWASASWASASWASASWASVSHEDGAEAEYAIGGEFLTTEELIALGIIDPPVLTDPTTPTP